MEGNIMRDSNPPEPKGSLTFLEMLQSTLWAALGVQKSKNHERDFERGSWIYFVLMGIGFTGVFVLCMILLVKLVVANAA